MKADRLVRSHFDLAEVLLGGEDKEDFLTHLRWLLRL